MQHVCCSSPHLTNRHNSSSVLNTQSVPNPATDMVQYSNHLWYGTVHQQVRQRGADYVEQLREGAAVCGSTYYQCRHQVCVSRHKTMMIRLGLLRTMTPLHYVILYRSPSSTSSFSLIWLQNTHEVMNFWLSTVWYIHFIGLYRVVCRGT